MSLMALEKKFSTDFAITKLLDKVINSLSKKRSYNCFIHGP